MKVTASVVMYSGLPNPEMSVSPDTSQVIIEKLNTVYERSSVKIKDGLGFRGYMVVWHGGDGVPYTAIRVHDGIISIQSFLSVSYMKDTIGLEGFLKALLEPTIQAHHEEARKQMEEATKKLEDHREKMLRTTK